MNLLALLKSLYVEAPVADETVWHKRIRAPWFACTVDGELIHSGQIWRRKRDGKWEYKQDPLTDEEIADAFF